MGMHQSSIQASRHLSRVSEMVANIAPLVKANKDYAVPNQYHDRFQKHTNE